MKEIEGEKERDTKSRINRNRDTDREK